MSLSVQAVKFIRNEYNIVKGAKRAAQLAKNIYPDKKMMESKILISKLAKDVGPEPVVGAVLGTVTNPIPGLGILGYGVGRLMALGRQSLLKSLKSLVK